MIKLLLSTTNLKEVYILKKFVAPVIAMLLLVGTGKVNAEPTPPPSTSNVIYVTAKSDLAGGKGAKMNIHINGVCVAMINVESAEYTLYSINGTFPASSQVDVVYVNDAIVNGVDRNLYVKRITVETTTMYPTDTGVIFDRGSEYKAFDGKDTLAGREWLKWNGALRFPAVNITPKG